MLLVTRAAFRAPESYFPSGTYGSVRANVLAFASPPLVDDARALAFVARALGMAAWVMAGGWVASGARRASLA